MKNTLSEDLEKMVKKCAENASDGLLLEKSLDTWTKRCGLDELDFCRQLVKYGYPLKLRQIRHDIVMSNAKGWGTAYHYTVYDLPVTDSALLTKRSLVDTLRAIPDELVPPDTRVGSLHMGYVGGDRGSRLESIIFIDYREEDEKSHLLRVRKSVRAKITRAKNKLRKEQHDKKTKNTQQGKAALKKIKESLEEGTISPDKLERLLKSIELTKDPDAPRPPAGSDEPG